jgi:hypothetical protein
MDAALRAIIQGIGEDSFEDLDKLAQSLRDRGRRDQSIAVYEHIFGLTVSMSPVKRITMLRV